MKPQTSSLKPQASSSRLRIPSLRLVACSLKRDTRGVAALEGLLVVALLAGVFLACLLLGQWGSSLQSAQMGARLLAFDAGDVSLARMGKPSNQPAQQFTNQNWDTLAHGVNVAWLHNMYSLSNGSYSGSVTGSSRGRLPGQGMFQYSPKTIGYYASGWAAASDPWGRPESVVQSGFIRIAYRVGLTRASPAGLDSTSARPIPHGDTVLETIYGLVGQ
jgi:hypothetical protein